MLQISLRERCNYLRNGECPVNRCFTVAREVRGASGCYFRPAPIGPATLAAPCPPVGRGAPTIGGACPLW
jgi:hypothetical protein